MNSVTTRQTCYSYGFRELALALGITPSPQEWIMVEVDEDTVDVIVRGRVES